MGGDVIVLGAGPGGVGAALTAARAGHNVVVLERASGPGGAAGSFEVAGQRVDFGSHRLHPSIEPRILAEIRNALGGDLQERRRNGRIRLAGRWISFPLRASDLVRHLPPSFALGAVKDAATGWQRRPRADTFEEVLRAGLGPTLCERFYFPYARKMWGLEPSEISGEQARRRVSADTPRRIVARIAKGARGEPPFFYYPRRGFGQICEALAGAARDAGASFRYGAEVERVEVRDDGVRVGVAGDDAIEGDIAFSTLPLTVLAELASPGPPPAVAGAAAALDFRAMLLIYLVLDTDRYTPYDAHYLPETWTPVTRISEPKNYRDGEDPPNRTVLCAEIPCSRGDDLWGADDAVLGEIVERALVIAKLPRPRTSQIHIKRMARVYPVYRTGYERAFEVIDRWATGLPRLVSLGRGGLFVHDNSHHAYAMGWAAGEALHDDGSFDDGAWKDSRHRFRSHVVED